MTIMDEQAAAKLRASFTDAQVEHLPRVWCKACRDSRDKHCDRHQIVRCEKCGTGRITSAHVDLSYVGHAETTDRLLSVDPGWSWEPLAFGSDGLPAVDRDGGLWIRMTVCGVTRLGYGDAEGKTGPSATKEKIGDAIRNAAMRFGVGIELWGASGHVEAQAQRDEHESSALHPAPATAKAKPAKNGNGATGTAATRPAAASKPTGDAAAPKPDRSSNAKDAVHYLLAANTEARAEQVVAKVAENGDGALDATGHLADEDREVLGDRLDETVTLDDLCAAVLGYWSTHGTGPRFVRELVPA